MNSHGGGTCLLRVMKSRGMRWAGNVQACKFLVGKHETERGNLDDPDTHRRTILKWIIQKHGGMGQTDLSGPE